MSASEYDPLEILGVPPPLHVPPFPRTVCACAECVRCCKEQPGPLAPGDAERIAAFLGEPVEKFLVDSPGALAVHTGTKLVRRIRTITPARKRDGSCVFLGPDDRCQIHPVAPFGCAYFDTHQGEKVGNQRSVWFHSLIDKDAGYHALRSKLSLATKHKPTWRRQ